MPATLVRLARLSLFWASVLATLATIPAVGAAQPIDSPPADSRIGLPPLPAGSIVLAGLDPTEARQEAEAGGAGEITTMLVGGILGAAAGGGLGLVMAADCYESECVGGLLAAGVMTWAGGAVGAWAGGRVADGDPSILGSTVGALLGLGLGVGTLVAIEPESDSPVTYLLVVSVTTGALAALLGSG